MPISPLVVFVPPTQHAALSEGTQREIRLPASKTWAEVLEPMDAHFDRILVLISPQQGGKWKNKLDFPFRGFTKETPAQRSKNKGEYVLAAKP